MTISKAYARMKHVVESCGATLCGNAASRYVSGRALLFLICGLLALGWIAGCGGGGSKSAITIEITPGTTQNVDQGQSLNFTATLSNDVQNQGVTWSLSGSSCSGAGCGMLSNSTSMGVTFTAPTGATSQITVTLTATSVADTKITKTVSINVVLPPSFTTTSLPNGANGIPYNQAIVVTGGVDPLSFTLASGSLPPGLTLNLSGTILGTPSCPGSVPTASCPANAPNTYSFVVRVTDSGNPPLSVNSLTFTIVISPPPPLSITSSGALPPATVNAAYSAPILTSGGVPPFSWSILSGSLPPGLTLNATSGQITGTPTMASGTPFSFTPQVQDSSIPKQVVSTPAPLTIQVIQPAPLAISTQSLPAGTVATAYSAFITATGGIPPYTFSVATGLLPSGLSLNVSSGEITGSPILVTNSTFTISVKDSGTVPATASATLTIGITAGTSDPNTLFANTFAFLFTGFDADGAVVISGTFTSSGNGIISTGSEDINRASGITQAATLTGSYTIGTDGRGTLKLIATNSVGQTTTTFYQIVLQSDRSARFFANETVAGTTGTLTRGSGIIRPQVGSNFAAANFNGNYSFGFAGQDSSQKPAALAGTLHANGSSVFSPGTIDFNDAGTYSPAMPLSGNFSVANPNGRGIGSLIFQPPSSAQVTLQYAFYMVSSADIFFIAIDPTDATHPRLAGEMIQQDPTTVFNSGTLSGVGVASGTGLNASATVFVGLLSGDGNGNASISYTENNAGVVSTPNFASAYSVTTAGRANFTSGLGPRVAAAYLTGPNQGFLIGSDAAASSGFLENQSGGPVFGASSFQGGFTISGPFTVDTQVNNILGQITADGTSTAQGTVDEFDSSGTPNLAQPFTGAYSVQASGQGQMTTNTPLGFPTNLATYVVSHSQVRAVSTDAGDAHPQVIFLDH